MMIDRSLQNATAGITMEFLEKHKTLLATFPQKGDLDLFVKQERRDWATLAIEFAVKEVVNNKKRYFFRD